MALTAGASWAGAAGCATNASAPLAPRWADRAANECHVTTAATVPPLEESSYRDLSTHFAQVDLDGCDDTPDQECLDEIKQWSLTWESRFRDHFRAFYQNEYRDRARLIMAVAGRCGLSPAEESELRQAATAAALGLARARASSITEEVLEERQRLPGQVFDAKPATTPAAQTEQAQAVSRRTAKLRRHLERMLNEARRERDAMRTNCLTRKLTDVQDNEGNLHTRQQALDAAIGAGDDARREYEHEVITVLAQKLDMLAQQSSQCVGASVYEPGASQVVTTIPSGVPAYVPRPEPNREIVRIFYGTDRERAPSEFDRDDYGPDRRKSPGLWLGTCDVSIPLSHVTGTIERPLLWKLEFREDPAKHIVLLDVEQRTYDDFYAQLATRIKKSSKLDMLVFVHGYDVNFRDAAIRTAQIARDLKFAGAPVLYSWPSQAELRKYTVDETNAAWTAAHFLNFLRDLRTKSGAERIHIIAHSMGNRPVIESLRALASSPGRGAKLRYVLLMAPDIDADTFKELAADIQRSATQVTLYASSNDRALLASKALHGYPRAGDAGDRILVLPGMETIDVSAADTSFLGHSYYGHRSVLDDVFYLVRHDLPAKERAGLNPISGPAGIFYWFRP